MSSMTKNKTIKLEKPKSHILDLDGLNRLSKEHQNNAIIGYRNINTCAMFKKKLSKTQIHVLCIDETKLDESFPDAQFYIEDYQYPAIRKDCNKNGGGKIVYVKEGLNSIKTGLLRVLRCWGDQMVHPVYLLIEKCYLLEIWQKDSKL